MAGLLIGEELDQMPLLLADPVGLELGGAEALQTVVEQVELDPPGVSACDGPLDGLLVEGEIDLRRRSVMSRIAVGAQTGSRRRWCERCSQATRVNGYESSSRAP